MTYQSGSDEETKSIAQTIMEDILQQYPQGPLLIGLVGDLGAGKTTFMKGVAEFFNISDPVTSPTFIVQKLYTIPESSRETRKHLFRKLVHMDLYRLEGEESLNAIRWEEYATHPENIVCVEWPHQVWQSPPKEMILLTFRHEGDVRRTITYGK